MAAFKAIGNLLKESGWTAVLTEARIASSGTAESFLKKKVCPTSDFLRA